MQIGIGVKIEYFFLPQQTHLPTTVTTLLMNDFNSIAQW